MDAGTYTNTASASGTSPTGAAIAGNSDSATVTLQTRIESAVFDKIPSTTTYTAVGDSIDYVFSVRNTGNVTLTNVVVVDSPLGFTCLIARVDVGATDNTTCKVTKTITQEDIDEGQFVNTATAESPTGLNEADTETATGPIRSPSFEFEKSSTDSFAAVGDQVEFDFLVRNTGNVTLTNTVITDSFFNPNLSCTIPTLAPTATDNTTCSGTYTITQADLDAGIITNTATANTNSRQGALPAKTSTEVVNAQPEVASFTVTKSETDGGGTFGAVGTSQGYQIRVRNTGLVTLLNITVVDPLTGLNCTVATLAPGASTTTCDGGAPFAGSCTIDQDDVDAGSLSNTVKATATTTLSTNLEDDDTVVLTGPPQAPVLGLTKTATSGANYAAIDDKIAYDYVVTNNGNVTLTQPITIADNRVSVNCPGLPSGGLAPGGTLTCTASETITQAELDAGSVVNRARASVTQTLTNPAGSTTVNSNRARENVTVNQTPKLTINKSVKSGTDATYALPGDTVTYTFEVTNTGNVTTTGPMTVNDPDLTPANITCGPASGVAPGATVTCEGTWIASQTDIDTGQFTNSATVSMPFGGATIPGDAPSSATVYAVQRPELTIEKDFRPGTLNPGYQDLATATYDYVIENTGNQTILGPVTVNDNLIAAVDCSSFTGNLAPGATMTCEGTYTLNADNVSLGSTTNVASAQGQAFDATLGANAPIESVTDAETIPLNAVPALSIAKTSDISAFTKAGDIINYTYIVTNTSTGAANPAFANPITIEDDRFGAPINCWQSGQSGASTGAPGTVLNNSANVTVGESVSCTEPYTVTQDDVDAISADGSTSSFVTNTAFARTMFGVVDVVSEPKTVTVTGAQTPSLNVDKVAAGPNDPALVGDTITYTITTTNNGNQTISGIVVDDPMLANLSCTVGGAAAPANLVLAPTEAAICTGTYVVTQDDIDAQELENTATATGSDPLGDPVTDNDTETYDLDPIMASVDLDKTMAVGSPAAAFTAVGDQITYAISVTNNGNVTLTQTEVTDVLFPGQTCVIGSLAPTDTDTTTCQFTYTVTQADVDAGQVDNTATATSQPATPGAAEVDDTSGITAFGTLRSPSVGIVKSADVSDFTAPNQPIVYTYVVTNTGNITLTTAPTVTDDKITAPNSVTCDPLPAGGLAPQATLTCSATYQTTQTDVDTGSVTNLATVSIPNPLGGAALTDTDTVTVGGTRTSELVVTKMASDDTDVVAGQMVTYTYVVTNNGNTTLTNVTLSDEHVTQAGTANLTIANNVIATLVPGASDTRAATYTVTQADIDAGSDLTNTVTASGTAPTGARPVGDATAEEVVTVAGPEPELTTIKTAAALPANPVPGTTVNFTITVKNTGNVTMENIVLVDTLRRSDGSLISPRPVPVYDSGDAGVADKMEIGET